MIQKSEGCEVGETRGLDCVGSRGGSSSRTKQPPRQSFEVYLSDLVALIGI